MRLIILLLATMAIHAGAQELQCVDVPKWHKLVIVPKRVPTEELVWKWYPAKDVVEWDVPEPPTREDPVTGVVERFIYQPCSEDELVVSPAVCGEWVPAD